MSNEPTSRADRREAERESRKDFEATVKAIKNRLAERQDDAFKVAVMSAIQHLELEPKDNNKIAALMIDGCVDCVERNDEASAKLLLYVSGAITDDNLVRFTLEAIEQDRVRRMRLQVPGNSGS